MGQEVALEQFRCGKGQGEYFILVVAKDVDVLEAAKRDPSAKGKEGEALVAAIFAAAAPGDIFSIERRKLVSSPDVENDDTLIGILVQPSHKCDDGSFHHVEGEYVEYYHQNDGPNGEPAAERFNNRGLRIEVIHCKDGAPNYSIKGAPAYQGFNDNEVLIQATRAEKGVVTKELTPQECAAYQASLKKSPPPANKPKPRGPGR